MRKGGMSRAAYVIERALGLQGVRGFALPCRTEKIMDQLLLLLDQWDFQGPPMMGPPYGKLPILFP